MWHALVIWCLHRLLVVKPEQPDESHDLAPSCCAAGLRSFTDGDLLPSSEGWVWMEAPRRRVAPKVAWRLKFFDIANRGGDPYTWATCPFCGGDLPPLTSPDATGDSQPLNPESD